MAEKLIALGMPTGITGYFLILSSSGQIWNGSAFENYATANYANYPVAATESGTASGIYTASTPGLTAGTYGVAFKKKVGGSYSETADIVYGFQPQYEWDGSLQVALSTRLAPTTAGRTLDVSTTGEAGLDFDNVKSTGTLTLAALTITGGFGIGGTLSTNGNVTIFGNISVGGTTALTGAFTATNAGNDVAGINVAKWNSLTTVALPLVPTVAGRTLDVSAGGEAGVDWANVGSPTTTVGLSGTTVGVVTLVNTLTTYTGNTPQTGDVFPLASTEIADIKAKTDNLPSDPADESLVIAATDAIMARLGAPAGASVSADVAAVKTDTAAILVDTGTTLDGRIPAALVGGRMDSSVGAMAANVLTASAVADGAIDAAALAADVNTYQAKVWLFDDDAGTSDRYVAVWHKNGQPVTSGITSPTIQVLKAADGSDLVASAAMTEIASTGLYRYNEGTNRVVNGAAYVAKVTATIDSATRTWYQPVGRDG